MEIKLIQIGGVETAVRALRAPRRSYKLSDTTDTDIINDTIGKEDLHLALNLIQAGTDHSKFLRLMIAYFEIKAPRYFWQQFDTYRIGVEKVSESTMHDLKHRDFIEDDFEDGMEPALLTLLNKSTFQARKHYLPESYLQKRFVSASYQALQHIYHSRKSHKLKEWKQFCNYLETKLPYKVFITK